uniref:flagellin N-terminal helical domain-containing protein n=1 Tax=uncultured Rhizobium sp. TaxID=155567 RepID=UPI00261B3CDD|nr:flagellin [uncultured Rhizobium sp.]
MTSVSLNSASASALAMLGGSTSALERTQRQAASGREVEQAADNAAYWSIATTMKASSLSMSSVEDANGLAAALTDTAAVGIREATSLVAQIQSKLVLATAVGSNKQAINSEISQLKDQLNTVVESSAFNGQNWLKVEAGSQPKVSSMVASVTGGGEGDLSINMIDFDTAKSTLVSAENAADGTLTRSYSGMTRSGALYDYHLLDANSVVPNAATSKEIRIDSQTSFAELEGMVSTLNRVMADMVSAGAEIGTTRNRVSANMDFMQDLQDVTQTGIGRLVDADLNEQSVLLAAQLAAQQLQATSLNIANNSMGNSLKLFL